MQCSRHDYARAADRPAASGAAASMCRGHRTWAPRDSSLAPVGVGVPGAHQRTARSEGQPAKAARASAPRSTGPQSQRHRRAGRTAGSPRRLSEWPAYQRSLDGRQRSRLASSRSGGRRTQSRPSGPSAPRRRGAAQTRLPCLMPRRPRRPEGQGDPSGARRGGAGSARLHHREERQQRLASLRDKWRKGVRSAAPRDSRGYGRPSGPHHAVGSARLYRGEAAIGRRAAM